MDQPLQVLQVDFHTRENSAKHRTDMFDVPADDDSVPICRRGFSINLSIHFDRAYSESDDVVRVNFGFGARPNPLHGTRTILTVLPRLRELSETPSDWSICITSINENILMLKVFIAPNAQVGRWKCSIQTNLRGTRGQRYDHKVPHDIIVLFNPWSQFDGVYMQKSDELEEYVLNETGKVWCGSFKEPRGRYWLFSQFQRGVLDAVIYVLDRAAISPLDRGSPVLVTRAISAIVNSVDDHGVLMGRWDGEYSDGVSPHSWTSSQPILEQYYRSAAGTPVKYGQCWVFSAVVVTICRALGIPCRSVTNYVSAHDTNSTLTVDKYFDTTGNMIEFGPDGDCDDSCWNFHVWNDVWLARPDLPAGYSGWQVIDATPQEQSGRMYRCGPASVSAIKMGNVGLLFDTPFVFSEVNADVVHFQEDPVSDWGFSRLSINDYHVGRIIVTKAVGATIPHDNTDLCDITDEYKNAEGTEAERLAVYNAIKGVPKALQYYNMPVNTPHDVCFELEDIETVPLGEQFRVVVRIRNESPELRHISAMLSASSIYYNGRAADLLKKVQGSFRVRPGDKEMLTISITADEYVPKLVDHGFIKIYGIASVQETRQTWSKEDDFTLTKPAMEVRLISGGGGGVERAKCVVGSECRLEISFRNPLNNQKLTHCSYSVSGIGLADSKMVKIPDVEPSALVEIIGAFTPVKQGDIECVVNFGSEQLQSLMANITVNVEP